MEAPRRAGETSETDAGEMLDGRYTIFGEIGCGGMATVHYGRLNGIHGFARPVAIKRLHPHLCRDPDFVTMFADEARVSACLAHANIVQTLDVVQTDRELAIVMEYVHGESLSTLLGLLLTRGEHIPVRIGTTIVAATLHALEAAHNAKNEQGEPLMIVHRDVSPQNILIGADGVPRLLDFGIAKAAGRLRMTPGGELKGKLNYIAPEQLRGEAVSAVTDVYGAAVVLWEVLTGFPIFDGPNEAAILRQVFEGARRPPSTENRDVPVVLDRIVMRGLSSNPEDRFPSAREMADALEREIGVVSQSELADWLQGLLGEQLAARREALRSRLDTQSGLRSSGPTTPASTPRPRAHTRPGATPDPGTRRLEEPALDEPMGQPVPTQVQSSIRTGPTRVRPAEPPRAAPLAYTAVSESPPSHPGGLDRRARQLALLAGGLLAVAGLLLSMPFGNERGENQDPEWPEVSAAPAVDPTRAATEAIETVPPTPGLGSTVTSTPTSNIPARPAALVPPPADATDGAEPARNDGDHPTNRAEAAETKARAAPKAQVPTPRRARAKRQRLNRQARKPESTPEQKASASADPELTPSTGQPPTAPPSKKVQAKKAQTCVPVYEGQIKTYRCE